MMNVPEKIMITPNECEDGSQWDMIGEEVIGVLEKPYFHFPAGFELGASYTYIRQDIHEAALAEKEARIKELEQELTDSHNYQADLERYNENYVNEAIKDGEEITELKTQIKYQRITAEDFEQAANEILTLTAERDTARAALNEAATTIEMAKHLFDTPMNNDKLIREALKAEWVNVANKYRAIAGGQNESK